MNTLQVNVPWMTDFTIFSFALRMNEWWIVYVYKITNSLPGDSDTNEGLAIEVLVFYW